MQKKIDKIKDFLLKEAKKRGFDSVVFGLSGGIDSAIVAYFCNEVFGSKARAFIMPSLNTNPQNTRDAISFARSIGLYYEVVEIGDIQKSFISTLGLHDNPYSLHRVGNICARARMSVLYDMSFLHNALVIGCTNKSELMLGYGTLHGDLACAINPLGDIFKSDIFKLAKKIGIPSHIIHKKPSADLYAGQSDEGDLGYPYSKIDKLLAQIEKGLGYKELLAAWGNSDDNKKFIKSILNRVKKNRFKLHPPKIAKL